MFSVNLTKANIKSSAKNVREATGKAMVAAAPLLPMTAMAAGGGGLDQATQAMDEFRTWAYGALAIGCLIYMLYKVTMAFLEKHSWGDVFQGLAYCAIAGGIMVAADFMWNIWGEGGAL